MWLSVIFSQACMYFTVVKKERNMSRAERAKKEKETDNDLSKLKKKELLEIMLRQGEEIDLLRARVTDLEARLASKEISISKAGNLAEASLAVTAIFAEAQKAADIYLSNIRKAAGGSNEELYIRGADSDE